MKSFLTVLSAVGFIASASSATVTGLEVTFDRTSNGRDVYSVYALSSGPDASGRYDVLLNVFNHHVTAGSMANVRHTDNYFDNAGGNPGHWNASYTSASTAATSNQWIDSYVTITGKVGSQSSTSLDPSFVGLGVVGDNPAIPENAGWYTANPAVDIVITGGRTKIMQIAVVATTPGPNGVHPFEYTAALSIGYKLQGTSTALFANNVSYSIPAPGGLALLGFAGLAARRRRS